MDIRNVFALLLSGLAWCVQDATAARIVDKQNAPDIGEFVGSAEVRIVQRQKDTCITPSEEAKDKTVIAVVFKNIGEGIRCAANFYKSVPLAERKYCDQDLYSFSKKAIRYAYDNGAVSYEFEVLSLHSETRKPQAPYSIQCYMEYDKPQMLKALFMAAMPRGELIKDSGINSSRPVPVLKTQKIQ